MSHITYTLDLGVLGEVDCEIEYSFTPGRPATMYDRNGDPGSPADPAEYYVKRVKADGIDITNLAVTFLDSDEDFFIALCEAESEAANDWQEAA